MSGIDIEAVLSAEITRYLGAYTLPANYAHPLANERHWDVAERCGPQIAAHVAAVLREQIVTWLTSEALRTDLLAQVNAEDDAQFAGGASHGLGAHDATDFVLAALAAHLSDTERAGGAG